METGSAQRRSHERCLTFLRTSLWFSKAARLPCASRLLQAAEGIRKPPRSPSAPAVFSYGAQSYGDATSWFAGRMYFVHTCGHLGKYKCVW